MRKIALAAWLVAASSSYSQQQPAQQPVQQPAQQPAPQQPAPQKPTTAQQTTDKKPIIRWTASLTRDIPDDHRIGLPVELEAPNAVIAIREITRGAKQLDRSAVTAAAFKPDGAQQLLSLTLDPKRTADAGAYIVQLRVTPPAGTAFEPSTLTLTLTRTPAKLDVLSPIHFERTVYHPWKSTYEPTHFAISETGDSDATLRPRTWTVNALSAERTPHVLTVSEVEVKKEEKTNKVPRGGSLLVEVEGDDLPLGVVTGTMSVDSPQLAAPVPVTIEMRSRLSRLYLFLLIALGIAVGVWTRVHLEGKRSRATAQLAALPLWKELEALQRDAREPGVLRDVEALQKALSDAWKGKAETLTQAATDAKTALTALKTKIAEKKKLAADQVSALSAAIGTPDRQSGAVRAYVREINADVARIDADLKAGHFERAAGKADDLNGQLATRFHTPLASWRAGVDDLRKALAQWKELKLPELPDVGPLAAETPVSVTTKLNETATLTTTLQVLVERVERIGRNESAAHGSALEKFVQAVRDARERFLDDPTAVVAPLTALRAKLDTMVVNESPGANKASLEESTPVVTPAVVHVAPPKFAIAGNEIRFHATVLFDGEEATDVTLSWSVNGKHEYLGRARELTFSYTPLTADPLEVRAELIGAGARNASSNVVTVEPHPAHEFNAGDLEEVQSKALSWQTWIAGAIIAFAGLVMFSKSWIGSLQDMLTVFLWGLSTDIGVNKLIDLAKPLTKYAPTFTPTGGVPPASAG